MYHQRRIQVFYTSYLPSKISLENVVISSVLKSIRRLLSSIITVDGISGILFPIEMSQGRDVNASYSVLRIWVVHAVELEARVCHDKIG